MAPPWLALACFAACGEPSPGATDGSSSSESTSPTTIDTASPTATSLTSSADGSEATTAAADSSGTGMGPDVGGPGIDGCAAYDAFATALVRAEPDARDGLTAAFVASAWQSEHGLPVRCEGRLVVLAAADPTAALTVTGDFAQWDAAAHPLVPLVEGHGLLVADIAVTEPLAPSMYKLVDGGVTYFADPWARRFGWDEFGEYSLTDARDDASHHERYPAFAEGIGTLQPRDVVVYVPAGALARRELPVLYMHDGQNLFAPDAPFGGWRVGEAIDAAIAAGDVPPMLVVGVDNTADRFDEYSHVEDDLGAGPVGGRADVYADFVALGLKPFIDDRYPTRPGPDATAVLGSSMGGLVSLYLAWRHPDVFGMAGSMSGTLVWGQIGLANDRILELYEQQPPTGAWIYLDSGGNGPCPGDDSDNYCVNLEMRALLGALGWSEPEALVYVHAPGAQHDEAAWAARMPGFLSALGVALAAR